MSLSIYDMLSNLGEQTDALILLVTGVGYFLGIFLVMAGLYKLRQMGDHRSMMHQPVDPKGPLAYLVVGVGLVFLPQLFEAMTLTAWMEAGNVLKYANVNPVGSEFDEMILVLEKIMKVVGVIAFIRGWMMLIKVGEGHAQPGQASKAFTHIIGGVLCYHIYATFRVVEATFGFS